MTRNRFIVCSLVLLAVVGPPLLGGVLPSGDAHALEAGAAKADITPLPGVPLNGYLRRLGQDSLAVHDPVWARCLYLDDGKTALFLVCADLCWISKELRDQVIEQADGLHGVPRERIILTATHTHSAQGAMNRGIPWRAVAGRFLPDVVAATARGIVEAMEAAYANRRRAALGFGVCSGEGLSMNRQGADGPVDGQIGVIRVDDSDGNPIAIAVNFAAHPATVDDTELFSISADFPGYSCEAIEQLTGGTSAALFMNGAVGDQQCANPDRKAGWAYTESIGQHLAIRAHKMIDEIPCGEVTLDVGYAAPTLPPTIAAQYLPDNTVLQTLGIRVASGKRNGAAKVEDPTLLLTFFPGEPCAELGLELRRRALEWGYTAQFTVGLANDYLGHFVSASLYATSDHEMAMNFYGPGVEDWFYRQFQALAAHGASDGSNAEPPPPAAAVPEVDQRAGMPSIALEGSPYAIGYQRGAAFSDRIRETYARNVVERVQSRQFVPGSGRWTYAPRFVDLTPLALPALAMAARPRLSGLPVDVVEEVEGLADGAGLPFDAVWLLSCLPPFRLSGNDADWFPAPWGVMLAAVDDRAGADDVLVGCRFDWWNADAPVVMDVRPAAKYRFVQIGLPWQAGGFAGMNETGLVMCVAHAYSIEQSAATGLSIDQAISVEGGPPPMAVLQSVLWEADSLDAAVSRLQTMAGLRGCHVMLATPRSKGKMETAVCVMEFGETVLVRKPESGFLLGADPDSPYMDVGTQERYHRATDLLNQERIIAAVEIEQALRDREDEGAVAVTPASNCRVVFEPSRRRMRLVFSGAEGEPIESTTVSLSGKEGNRSHE